MRWEQRIKDLESALDTILDAAAFMNEDDKDPDPFTSAVSDWAEQVTKCIGEMAAEMKDVRMDVHVIRRGGV